MTGGRARRRGAAGGAALAAAAVFAAIAGGGGASPAWARSAVVVPYPSRDVWPAAIRLLRVDRDYTIKEKDEPAGYVLFELLENKRAYRAALEMVRTTDGEGRAATQIICSVPDLPRRYEAALLDALGAKVRDEQGPAAPPPARKPPPPSSAKDGKPEDKPEGGKPDPSKPDEKAPGDFSELPRPPTWGPPPRP